MAINIEYNEAHWRQSWKALTELEKTKLMILYPYPKIFADQVIHIKNDSAFLWVGDRTKGLKGKDLRNLEYSKSIRYFEDECNMDEEIEDRDEELIKRYKKKWPLNHRYYQVLRTRGFVKKDKRSLIPDQCCCTAIYRKHTIVLPKL
ncbi:hypothetical protein GCWU000282_01318 [Catonella morbi ATCC 51271]|uniref:Uncharacterized protein n=2 Tax=Catonella TaxID=43996 RepID=V2Y7H1_9FIRM|nr:hypothetical protein GCWU000282_01318 [Catonella morbi ATCC 51271]